MGNSRFRAIALWLPVLWCLSGAAAAPDASLDDLGWLAGYWVGSIGDVAMEEIWMEPRGGVMLGLHRDVFSDRPVFFEYLRVEQRESSVVLIASPRGRGATEFTQVSSDAAGVVFENLQHDFPQRIIYRRQGDLLIAKIEGEVSGELRVQEWEWRLVDPGWEAERPPE
jgi:hypothetical protein